VLDRLYPGALAADSGTAPARQPAAPVRE
jgi:hypothetical protein